VSRFGGAWPRAWHHDHPRTNVAGSTPAVRARERARVAFEVHGYDFGGLVDGSARDHASVFVNGGRRGLEIELSPDDLIAALGAAVAPIAR
jgi:hypothetical protein